MAVEFSSFCGAKVFCVLTALQVCTVVRSEAAFDGIHLLAQTIPGRAMISTYLKISKSFVISYIVIVQVTLSVSLVASVALVNVSS